MTTSTSTVNTGFTPSLERSTLTAVFPDRAEARHVINDLRAFGLRPDQISLAMRDRRQQDKLVADTGLRASEGAAGAAGAERQHDGLRGFMAGLRTFIFPGNPSLAAASQAPQGAVAPGGMIGTFISMRMSEAAARRQESGYRDGSVLLTARVFEEVGEATDIMQRHGGAMVRLEDLPATV